MSSPLQTAESEKNRKAYGALLEVASQEKKLKVSQGYIKAYGISFLFPPMGVYYFIKYLFFADGTSNDIKAGVIALFLTVISVVISVWSLAAFFGQLLPTGSSTQSLELLKKSASPENIKEIMKLYQ